MTERSFLFLQGLPSPFFRRIAAKLAQAGCRSTGVNLCFGDQLFWHGADTVNFRGRAGEWPRFVDALLEARKITDVVLVGEQRSYHREAIEAAKRRGLRVIVTDFGYLRPDWIVLEHDGMGGNSLFPRDPDAIRSIAARAPHADLARRFDDSFWTLAAGDVVYHLGNFLFWWLYPHYRRPYRRDNPFLHYPFIAKRLLFARWNARLASARIARLAAQRVRFFLFPLQLENDFQILSYSPFRNLDEAIWLVLRSFARHARAEDHLLVKVHPLDPGVKSWRRRLDRWCRNFGLAGRVHYIDGGSLDEAIRASTGVVTVNSTAGIRALQLRRSVKVLGTAIYDVAGLTDPAPLDQFWSAPVAPDGQLVDAFVDAIAHTIHVRGVFYRDPGLGAAVDEAVRRLLTGLPDPRPAGAR